ncbi:MAG: hypothetical protein HKN23_21250, partial [Verrucomicrobiales bacterium]|nr:hypothetical protein [Verrucomicrobiales bacterium]
MNRLPLFAKLLAMRTIACRVLAVTTLVTSWIWMQSNLLAGPPGNDAGSKRKALSKITLSSIEFEESPLSSVLDYLRAKTRAEGGHPSNFILYDPNGTIAEQDPKVSFKLKKIPITQVIKYACELSNTEVLVDRNAIVIGTHDELFELKMARRNGPANAGRNGAVVQLARTPVPRIDFQGADLG